MDFAWPGYAKPAPHDRRQFFWDCASRSCAEGPRCPERPRALRITPPLYSHLVIDSSWPNRSRPVPHDRPQALRDPPLRPRVEGPHYLECARALPYTPPLYYSL
jgi:hypothetical protein